MKYVLFAFMVALAGSAVAQAKQRYVPESLYAYERVGFDNGFVAILNPRQGAAYVSMRLVVATGSGDFDCTDRELPHLVEHLTFSGTSQYTETELEELVTSLGGQWNAVTAWDKTIYEMDIFSGNANQGVEILYQLFTDTDVSEEDLNVARDVVYLEAGGAPNALRQFLHQTGIMEGSIDKAALQYIPESKAFCERIPTTDHIEVRDIDRYKSKYHVPRNMMLIAVGDFDAGRLKTVLKNTFGLLPDVAPPKRQQQRSRDLLQRKRIEYNTRLDPVLSSTTYLSLDFEVPLDYGPERIASNLLANYLGEKLFEELRVKRGLAYAPGASVTDVGEFATLSLEAEVDNGNADTALDVIEGIVRRTGEEGIAKEELERLKQSTLYAHTQLFEGNNKLAELYARFSHVLFDGRPLPDFQADIEAIDAEHMRKFAAERLRTDRALVFVQAPTIGYGQLTAVIVIVACLIGWFGFRRYRRSRNGVEPHQGTDDA